ncbi:hypothetical protein [Mangrovivirga cuniculi]|uniref:hypothetical protein n=1 Tax=Mangrovivirga cuniculi TaxID=2715131 RepID=UPI00158638F4|nr:hypothetical protein [Mangrovivirga cuniculi]
MKDSKKKSKKAQNKSKEEVSSQKKNKEKDPKGLDNLPDDFDLRKLMGCGG